MLGPNRILAIVPARSGSKGIPDKNLQQVGGLSLIARAGEVLADLNWIDARVISTDSGVYAEEGQRHGLQAPFLRPTELSGDGASAMAVVRHALTFMEDESGESFDIILIVEPTSPLRRAVDIRRATELLLKTGAPSVVTVSVVDPKNHPGKVFTIRGEELEFYETRGRDIVARQQLERLFTRNGLCYALTRECVEGGEVIPTKSVPLLIDRPVANIDTPLDLEWAEFLLSRDSTVQP
jgi:CMP-N-acetylneuraminic acid synthetase